MISQELEIKEWNRIFDAIDKARRKGENSVTIETTSPIVQDLIEDFGYCVTTKKLTDNKVTATIQWKNTHSSIL